MASSRFTNICVVVDGSDASNEAVRVAVEMARSMKARLTAVSVVDTETLRSLLSSHILVDEEREEFESELEVSSQRYLDRARELAHKSRQEVETILLRGAFHSAILMEARERKVDLLVLGYSPMGATKRDLMSHERELIMNEIKAPVLLVKEPKGP